jgi:hypothetical protein
VADLAKLYRRRGPVETALAPLQTMRPMDVPHGKTVPGVRKDVTVFALVDTLVRLVMWPSAALQHIRVARLSCLVARRWLGAPSIGG